ncbi:MAG: M56 family metallopeptidase [Muribaculaceae bacterium]|nr:M56 family metallopeptidase [Muribaculaceae bacterium]
MGSFLAYTLYSGVFLLLLYLVYKLFISGEKQIALNRIILLGCYVISFAAWPLGNIQWSPKMTEFSVASPYIAIGELTINTLGIIEEDTSLVPQILFWIYLIGALVVILKTILSTLRLLFYIRKGTFIRKDGYTLVVMPGNDTAPFSFGRHVVMSAVDYETVRSSVTAHELAHIRCRHYLDLIVAQAVCIVLWYNPAAWLMRDELKLIHEYQADAAVIDNGANPKEYQMLLIRKTVGNRFHTLANSLNHSKLKNRIAMMQKEKSSGRRRLRLLSLALAVVVALAVVNIPAIASGLKTLESAKFKLTETQKDMSENVLYASESMPIHEVIEDNIAAEAPTELSVNAYKDERKNKSAEEVKEEEKSLLDPEIAAEFPGGIEKLMTYLSHNIRYPFSAFSDNRTGKTLVGFVIQSDGSISDVKILESSWPDLDEEAMRVVKAMPKWTPAMTDGKPVASQFSLPINFRLQDSSNAKAATPKEEAPFIQLSKNGGAKLMVGPRDKDCEAADIQAIRVDGKLLTGDMTIDLSDIETSETFPPSEEFPGGLWDIKLKKK